MKTRIQIMAAAIVITIAGCVPANKPPMQLTGGDS